MKHPDSCSVCLLGALLWVHSRKRICLTVDIIFNEISIYGASMWYAQQAFREKIDRVDQDTSNISLCAIRATKKIYSTNMQTNMTFHTFLLQTKWDADRELIIFFMLQSILCICLDFFFLNSIPIVDSNNWHD